MDKKQNFPAPRAKQKEGTSTAADSESTTSAQSMSSNKGKAAASPSTPPKAKVITPELRKLLNRNVEVLPRKTVAQKGDGMPNK